MAEYLPSSVVDLTEEVSIIILGGITVLSQPQTKDEEVSGEENGKQTDIVNTEPFIGTLGGNGGRGGKDGGQESGGDGGYSLHYLGLVGCREGGLNDIGWICKHRNVNTRCEQNCI